MIQKLRRKFIINNMLIVFILLSVMLSMMFTVTRQQIIRENIQTMESVVEGPMKPFEPDSRAGEVRLPLFRLVLDAEGELLSCEGRSYDLSDDDTLMELIDAVHSRNSNRGVLSKYHLRYLLRSRHDRETIVFADMTGENNTMQKLAISCVLIGLGGLVLFFGVSLLVARWAVRPVEQAWERQKQFVSDASHELKTPLTVILADADLLQSEQLDDDTRSRFITSIREMGEQMRELVEELLVLTRADHTDAVTELKPLDWSRCVSDAVLPFEPVFYEKGLSIGTEISEGIFVRGDITQLRQVIEILLDNAQKYCAPQTETKVSLSRQGHNALLKVESSGDEIPQPELVRIFQRFYRLDKARSNDHSYGLGLAIAKRITENHNGKIWAESEAGCNRFLMQLPAV